MNFTAQQIAEILEGDIVGNPNVEVSRLSKIEEGEKGSLTFLSNPKYNPFLYTTKASITIVNKSFNPEKELETTLIKVEDAYSAFSKLLEFYNQVKNNKTGREQPHFIASTAQIGSNEYIGAFAYIGENVTIGENVKIYPNVYVGDNVVIGNNCTLFSGVKVYSDNIIGANCTFHSGVVIGGDGFGFAPQSDKNFKKHFNSDSKAVATEYDRIFTIIKSTGLIDTKDNTVQAAVSELFDLVNKFWDCNLEAFKGLADMYVEDERFKNNYIEKYGEEFPEFLKDAMVYFANK